MLYRLEVRIENGSGELLGAFGEYFRVLEPSVDFRLSLNRQRFKPGPAGGGRPVRNAL